MARPELLSTAMNLRRRGDVMWVDAQTFMKPIQLYDENVQVHKKRKGSKSDLLPFAKKFLGST